jgi:hypothetical protein
MTESNVRYLKFVTGGCGSKSPRDITATSAKTAAGASVAVGRFHTPGKLNSRSAAALFGVWTREKLVREAAYSRAQMRGFAPGAELEDWFAAEREVDRGLFTGN